MLINIKGRRGSGKTLKASALAYLCGSERVKYPNYELLLPNVIPFNLKDFLQEKYEHCLVILDEAYLYLEARTSGQPLNIIMSYVAFQSRKTDIDIILTEQLERTIDVRYRDSADIEIYCRAMPGGIEYYYTHVEYGITVSKFFPWMSLVPFFSMFDTNQRIAGISNMSKTIDLVSTPEQKEDDAEANADKLFEKYAGQRITLDVINAFCVLNGLSALQRKVLIPIVRKRLKENA